MSIETNNLSSNEIIIDDSSNKKRILMSNPKNFTILANKVGVYYEHLLEGKECLGPTNLARLFEGNCSRGGMNSTCIDVWINTFEYIADNNEHVDNEIPKPFSMKPKQEYFDFVDRISKIITDETTEIWKKMSKRKLSEEAPNYDIVKGIKNKKALDCLLERMLEMMKRRKNNIWSKEFGKNESLSGDDNYVNYNMNNVPQLRKICKERGLDNAHLKKKEELVKLIEDNPLNATVHNKKEEEYKNINYTKLNCIELKSLAKERGLTVSNNLSKAELIDLHNDYDLRIQLDIMILKYKDLEAINKKLKLENLNLKYEAL